MAASNKKENSSKSTGSLLGSKISKALGGKGKSKGSELTAIGLGLSGAKPRAADTTAADPSEGLGAFLVPVDLVSVNPHNPRKKERTSEEMEQLMVSIETTGQGAPVIVRQDPKDPTRYIVEKGSGRVTAIRNSQKINEVWCAFRQKPLEHSEEVSKKIEEISTELGLEDYDPYIELEAVTENVSRDDMDVLDIGGSAIRLSKFGIDHKQYADSVGLRPREVSEMVTLVKTDDVIRNLYIDGKAKFSACLYLARGFKKDPEFILDAIRNAEEKDLVMSVSWAENLKKMVMNPDDNVEEQPSDTTSDEVSDSNKAIDSEEANADAVESDNETATGEGTDQNVNDVDKSGDESSEAEDDAFLAPSNGIVKRSRSKATISVKVGNSSGTLAIDYAASEPDKIVVELSNGELKAVSISECTIVGYE